MAVQTLCRLVAYLVLATVIAAAAAVLFKWSETGPRTWRCNCREWFLPLPNVGNASLHPRAAKSPVGRTCRRESCNNVVNASCPTGFYSMYGLGQRCSCGLSARPVTNCVGAVARCQHPRAPSSAETCRNRSANNHAQPGCASHAASSQVQSCQCENTIEYWWAEVASVST